MSRKKKLSPEARQILETLNGLDVEPSPPLTLTKLEDIEALKTGDMFTYILQPGDKITRRQLPTHLVISIIRELHPKKDPQS